MVKAIIFLPNGADFYSLANISGYVNDRQIFYPDMVRTTNVKIGGCSYIPKIPKKDSVIAKIDYMVNNSKDAVKTSIELMCYLMKTQVFTNGNKRTALIFSNLFLITKGVGFLSFPYELDKEFKILLVEYYENKNEKVKSFLLKKCFNKI